MKLVRQNAEEWTVSLQSQVEARALLAAQASRVGNLVLSTTDPNIDRLTPGRKAIERLHFAEQVLPADGETSAYAHNVGITFPSTEAQILSGLMYGVAHAAKGTGQSVTEHDTLLLAMEREVEAFFGMD